MKFISVKFNKCDYAEVKKIMANRYYSLVTRSSLQDLIDWFTPKCTTCSKIVINVPNKWEQFEFFGYFMHNNSNSDQISLLHDLMQNTSVSIENADSIHDFFVKLKLLCTECKPEVSKPIDKATTYSKETQTDFQEYIVAAEPSTELLLGVENRELPSETTLLHYTNEESTSNSENHTENSVNREVSPMDIDEQDQVYDSERERATHKQRKLLPGFIKVEALESEEARAYIDSVKKDNITEVSGNNTIRKPLAIAKPKNESTKPSAQMQLSESNSEVSSNNSSPQLSAIAVKQEVVEDSTAPIPTLEDTSGAEPPMLLTVKHEVVEQNEEEEFILPIKIVARHSGNIPRIVNIKQEVVEESDNVDLPPPPVPPRSASLRSNERRATGPKVPDHLSTQTNIVVKREIVDAEDDTQQKASPENPQPPPKDSSEVANLRVKIEENDNHDYLTELEELVETLPNQNSAVPSTSCSVPDAVVKSATITTENLMSVDENTEYIEPPSKKVDTRAAAVSWAKQPGVARSAGFRRSEPFRPSHIFSPKPPVKRFGHMENKAGRTKCTMCNTHIMAPSGSNRMQSLNYSIVDHVRRHITTMRFCCRLCTFKGRQPASVKVHIKNEHPGRSLNQFIDLTHERGYSDETRAMARQCFPGWDLQL